MNDNLIRTAAAAEFLAPCAKELARTVKPISLDTPVLQVLEQFQNNTDLPALPVMDHNNNYFGIISRRNYLNLMTKAFARELYARKDLFALLESNPEIFVAPLIADAEDRVDRLMVDFLNRDPGVTYDAMPVISKGHILGVIKVADMMLSMSKSQGDLIDTMQRISARLNAEVHSAAALQKNLLRPTQIQLPGLRGVVTLIPSSEIGGDFYDYYAVDGRWSVILVGDVSGHGIAAGTIACAAKAGVNFLISEKAKEPAIILSRLSNIIFNTAHQSLLMTMFAICIDTQTGELKYANAGHQFAYIHRAVLGQLETLEIGGLPLGKNEHTDYEQAATEIDLGDRVFLYTDSIVEEENHHGECFGYERLEAFLVNHADHDVEHLPSALVSSLALHVGRDTLNDDLTIFCIEHTEKTYSTLSDQGGIAHNAELLRQVHIDESSYRTNPEKISPHIKRQDLIFLAQGPFSDLIPDLSAQGIRRILLQEHPINQQLGWGNLLNQHLYQHHDDLAMYLRSPEQRREFHFSHSDDKPFVIREVDAWLQEVAIDNPERLDTVAFLLDELIENSLYAAPRDGKGKPLFAKGTPRELAAGEILRLDLSIQDGLLALSMTDNWGTLTPNVFLNRLTRHVQGSGLVSGLGGGGLYLIWRLCDYLQLRVFPHQQTQVCAFLDLNNPSDPEADKSYQFLYHTELYEAVSHD